MTYNSSTDRLQEAHAFHLSADHPGWLWIWRWLFSGDLQSDWRMNWGEVGPRENFVKGYPLVEKWGRGSPDAGRKRVASWASGCEFCFMKGGENWSPPSAGSSSVYHPPASSFLHIILPLLLCSPSAFPILPHQNFARCRRQCRNRSLNINVPFYI